MNPLLRYAGWGPAESPDDEALFWKAQHAQNVHSLQLLHLLSIASALLWYPTDAWVFETAPAVRETFGNVRVSAALVSTATLLLMRFAPLAPRHAAMLGMAGGGVLCFETARSLGSLGGADEPWFHFTYFFLVAPMALSLRPGWRVALTCGFAVCLLAGYFGPTLPRGGVLPAVTLSYLLFVTATSLLAGLVGDGLRRRVFFTQLRAERKAVAFAELSNTLDTKVRERTAALKKALESLEAAREDERMHIARDLHDELGQEITGLAYSIDLALMKNARGENTQMNLREIQRQTERLRTSTRNLLAGLRTPVLEHLNLEAAVEWLASRLRERSNLACEVEIETSEKDVPGPLATAVFRILQEALTNAARHAGATRVDVSVRCGPRCVEVSVRDDGSGFDPRTSHRGFGLTGMDERVKALGGSLEVTSTSGAGTRIRVTLPRAEERMRQAG